MKPIVVTIEESLNLFYIFILYIHTFVYISIKFTYMYLYFQPFKVAKKNDMNNV